ncbi:MAG: hypothetical protein IKO61_06235 [Lachnospiraceae bacterium]|nr:hypothetical protein [Lachnospiraceae bacterium]
MIDFYYRFVEKCRTLRSAESFDREVYAGYVYTLMDFAEPEERKYYRAFV